MIQSPGKPRMFKNNPVTCTTSIRRYHSQGMTEMELEMRKKKEPHLGKCDSRPGRTLLSLGTLLIESPEVHFQRTSFATLRATTSDISSFAYPLVTLYPFAMVVPCPCAGFRRPFRG